MNSDSLELNESETKEEKCVTCKNTTELSDGSEVKTFDDFDQVKMELVDKPEILEFVIRLQALVKKHERKIRKLRSKLKLYKTKETVDISTQTNYEEAISKTITEEITEAAENALLQNGLVYEATSGMYYDYNTGYYYNAELSLYYDGNTGTYLKYDDKTKTYHFHSQVDVVRTKSKSDTKIKRKSKTKQERTLSHKRARNDQEALLEEGECSDSEHDTDNTDDDGDDSSIELSKSWPPCMRIILKETTIEKLKIGSLSVITCDGGTIGREGQQHTLLIPDINVSKTHAQFQFDRELNTYTITDLGSQNGTVLNGKRISEAKQISEPHEVAHGSVVQIGTTKLLCHVHDGQKTCGHCEPGLIQPETSTQEFELSSVKKSTAHRKELRRLRKKFGLDSSSDVTLPSGYSDRAEARRKIVGSSNENEKTQTTSVHESIASDNKGYKMLSKMGWNEGQALGKEESGITEPILVISNEGTTGLGSASEAVCSSFGKKSTIWKKAQNRFTLMQGVNLDAFKDPEPEEPE